MAVSADEMEEYTALHEELLRKKTRTPFVDAVISKLAESGITVLESRVNNVIRGSLQDWPILTAIREHFKLEGRPATVNKPLNSIRKKTTPERLGLRKRVRA